MSDQKIQLIIEALDKSKDAFAGLDKAIRGIGEQTRTTSQASSGYLAKIKESWMGLTVAAVAAGVTIQKALASINLGADAMRAEEAFAAMAQSMNVNAESLAASMRKAAAGFVDDSHLMQKAAFAMASDIDPVKIPQLFEAARMASRLTGKDVVESIDGIIQAVSTNMPRSLRQMGMITKEQMTILNQAVAAGVDEINLLDIVLANTAVKQAQLGDSQDNAAKQIKRFRVEVVELQEALGKGLIVVLQKVFGAFQWLASGALTAAAAIPKFLEMVSRLSAYVQDKIGNKALAAVALKDVAQMKQLADDLLGASGELSGKAAANMSGEAEKGRGADPAAAAKAKNDLQRLMDDLKRRIAAAKGADEIKKLREEWTKIERDINADIAKTGLDEFEKKLIDIDKKVEDLTDKAQKLPTAKERAAAMGEIGAWRTAAQGTSTSEAARADFDEWQKLEKDLEDTVKKRQAAREAEINAQLTSLDIAEKEGTYHRDTLNAAATACGH
jgi:hypothetical protein